MKLTIIGTGYVGLTSALCFANAGHQVLCIDKDQNKITKLQNGEPTIYEEGLSELLKSALANQLIEFSTDLKYGIEFSEAIFLAVGTPQEEKSGKADLSFIYEVARASAQFVNSYKIFITKSTVPVGTNHQIKKIINEISGIKIDVASNPEFMREGFAIQDFMQPDRIVAGVENEKSQRILQEVYQPWINKNYPILYTDITTAELIKYASNAFLMTKVAFINEIENLARHTHANIKDLTRGMGLDKRIGSAFLNPGPGIGGSCFPKDSMALSHIAHEHGIELSILNQVISANHQRFKSSAQRIIDFYHQHQPNNSNPTKIISILGLAFKAGTDDVRISPAIEIIKHLIADNFTIYAYDPQGSLNAQKILGDQIFYCDNLQQCYDQSPNIVILTEWQEFKEIKNFKDFTNKNVLDLRYIL